MNCHHIVTLAQKTDAQRQALPVGLPHELWQQRRSGPGTQYLVQAEWLDHTAVPGTCLAGLDVPAVLNTDPDRWRIERGD